MFLFKSTEKHEEQIIACLYEQILEASRAPVFYAELGVLDNLEGRYQMMLFHLNLILIPLKQKGEGAIRFSQALFDYFFKAIERDYRENGVSDYSIHHKMRKAIGFFYGSALTYEKAFKGKALKTVLKKNLYVKTQPKEIQLEKIEHYAKKHFKIFQSLSFEALKAHKSLFEQEK